MKKDSTQTGATLCSSMRPRSATTSWLNKFRLLALVVTTMLSVNQVWGGDWTKVSSVSEITSGGTFIIGYAANLSSDVIVPMQNSGSASTSGVGYMYSGTSNGSSGTGTIDMSSITETAKYEVTIVASTVVDDAVCIKIGDNYLGNEDTKNNCKLFAAESANTAFTIFVDDENPTGDFIFQIDVNDNYYWLQYNSSFPRFAVYAGTQKNLVLYKKAASITYTDYLTDCGPAVYNVTANLTHVTASSNIPSTVTAGGGFSTVISAETGYELPTNITVSGAESSWNKATGALTISNATGAVSITITGEEQTYKTLYLKPNANWKTASAKFAIYDVTHSAFIDSYMTAVGCETDIYSGQVPVTCTTVIFCHMDPSKGINWDGRWNQTSDLIIPDANDLYTITENSDNWGAGTWSTFVPTTFTISFDENGGTGSVSDITNISCGGSATLPTNNLTKLGHNPHGWNTNASGTGTHYNDGAIISDIRDDIELFAEWELASYTLTWNFDGGQCSGTAGSDYTAGGSVQYGASITYPTNEMMSKTGYDFTGWSSTPATMPAAATTITAQWTVRQCRVTWSINEDVTSYTDFNYNDALTLPTAPTTSDCDGLKQFVGWSASPIDGITDDCPDDLFTTAGDKKVTADVTYYAVFATAGGGGTVTHTMDVPQDVAISGYSDRNFTDDQGYTWSGKFSGFDNYGEKFWSLSKNSDNYHISSPTFAGNVSSIKFWVRQTAEGTRTIILRSNTSTAQPSVSDMGLTADVSQNANVQEVTITPTTQEFTQFNIYVSAGFGFRKIQVVTGGGVTYSGYITSCCTNITNVTPANLNATPQNDGADVYWDYVAGATGYEVSVDGEHWTPTNDYQTQWHTYRFTGYECGGDAVTWYVRAKNICYTSLVASSTFSTKPCSCTGYQFHYQDFSDNWNTNNICFESIGEGDNQLTEEFALPYAKNFNVSNHGEPLPGNKTVTTNFQYMTFYQYNAKTFGIQPREGNMGGALGRMHIFGNSGDNNKYIRWLPSGYTLQLGNGTNWPTTYNLTANSATWNETYWYTELVTLTDAQIGGKVFVGLKTQNGYVWCGPYSESINLSGLRTKSGADNSWVAGGLTTSYANKTGKFRIHANSGDKNWYLTFVPYLQLRYDANGGSGEMAASEWYSVEAAEGDRTVIVSANSFTAPTGHEFNGWNTQADGNGTNYSAGADWILRENQTNILYAKWSPIVYNVTYNLNGGAWNGSAGAATYTYGVGIATLATNVEKSGYTFSGWYDNADFEGEPVTTIGTSATGNKEFWAKWTFTITYRIPGGGGTLSSSAQTSVLSGETVTMPGLQGGNQVPEPYDCETLIGWTTSSAAYESKAGAMPDPFYAVGETSPAISGATTFYAVYSRPGAGPSGTATLSCSDISTWRSDILGGSDNKAGTSTTRTASDGTSWTTTGGIYDAGEIQLKPQDGVYIQLPTVAGNIDTIYIRMSKSTCTNACEEYPGTATSDVAQFRATSNGAALFSTTTDAVRDKTITISEGSYTSGYITTTGGTSNIHSIVVHYGSPAIISTELDCSTDILEFSVTYNANSGQFSGATTTCTGGTFKFSELPDNKYTICSDATCAGMTLVGWNSQMDGKGGLNYTPGQEITSVGQDEFTLYAQFAYNVNVKDNDSWQMGVHPSERGGSIDLNGGNDVCSPAKYAFIGWTTDNPETWKQTITSPNIFSPDKVTTYTPTAAGTQVTAVYGMSTSVGSQAFYISYNDGSTVHYLKFNGETKSQTTDEAEATAMYRETIDASENKYHLYYMNSGVKTYFYCNNSDLAVSTSNPGQSYGWVITTDGSGVSTFQSIIKSTAYLSYSSNFTTHTEGYKRPLTITTGAKEYKYYDETTCTAEITITFNAGGGTMDPVTTQIVGHTGDVITVPTCSYPGWNFLGWVNTPAAAQSDIKIDDENIYTNEDGHEYTIGAGNETLYAYYTKTPEPPTFDGNISDVWKIYVPVVVGVENVNHYEVGAKNISDASAHGEYTTTTRCIDGTDWAFTNVGTNQFTIQNPEGLYLSGAQAGDDNDIFFSANPSVWTMENKGDGRYKFVNQNTLNRYLAFQTNNGSPTFINTSTANESNPSYKYIMVGGCTDPVYTTSPGGEFKLNMLGNVRVTSTRGKTVRSVDALSISADNLTPNTAITLSAVPAVLTFCDATGAALSLTTDANGKLANTAVYVKYAPTAYNTTQTPAITATCGEQHQNFAGLVTGRSLPENFIIAQKVGDDWYALPNNMSNNQTNPAAVKISAVNEATGTATIYSDVVDHLAYQLQSKGTGTGMAFSSPVKSDYIIKANTTAASNTLGLYAQSGWTGDAVKYYEFTPITSDLVDYTLQNVFQTNYLGITEGNWGIGASNTVRFFVIDKQPAATITWQNEMLETQHAQNAAEDGVITLPTIADPIACERAIEAGWVFFGWGDQIATTKTATPTILVGGEVAKADKTYYAIFRRGTENVWRTSCPTVNTITYTANGGVGTDYVVYTELTTATAITVETAGFTKEGSQFIGWTVVGSEDNLIQPGGTISGIATDITVNAQWMGELVISGDVQLTSADGQKVATAATGITFSSTDMSYATALRITYRDETNEIDYNRTGDHSYTSSEFRLCNGSSYNFADGSNISLAEVTGAYEQTYSISYTPKGNANTLDYYTMKVEVLHKSTVIATVMKNLYGRTLPEKFAIVAHVGDMWYALPNNMAGSGTYAPVAVSVDNSDASILNWTATGAKTAGYSMKAMTADCNKLRFASKFDANEYCLWASENGSTGIRNWSATETGVNYRWTVTPQDANFQAYTLLNENNTYNLRYWSAQNAWGMYTSGETNLYFIPLTDMEVADFQVIEWFANKVLIETNNQAINTNAAKTSVGSGAYTDATVDGTTYGTNQYTLTTGDLTTSAGKSLNIQYQTTAGDDWYINSVKVPIIVSQGEYTTSESVLGGLDKSKHQDNDLVVRDGATLTMDATTGTWNQFKNVTIYPKSKVVVLEGKTMTTTTTTLFGGIDEIYNGSAYSMTTYAVPQLVLKGNLTHSATVQGLRYDIRLNKAIYYDLALPYESKYELVTDNKGGEDFTFWTKIYDGAARAVGGNDWAWYDWSAQPWKIKVGVGYLFAAKPYAGQNYIIIRHPMGYNEKENPNGHQTNTPEATKAAVALFAHNSTYDNNAGWNFIANPFMANFQLDQDGEETGTIQTGELVKHIVNDKWDGHYEWADNSNRDVRYVTTYDYATGHYSQHKMSETALPPFTGFFVQIAKDGQIVFDISGRAESAPARMLSDDELPREMEITLKVNGQNESDETVMLLTKDLSRSNAREFPDEQTKMVNDGILNYYTYGGEDTKMYANGMNYEEGQEWNKAGIMVKTAGEYTFSVASDKAEYIQQVLLRDMDSNTEYDLMSNDAKIYLDKGEMNDRFYVKIVFGKHNIGTGTTEMYDNRAPEKFILNDHMYIRANGVLFDGVGKRVK